MSSVVSIQYNGKQILVLPDWVPFEDILKFVFLTDNDLYPNFVRIGYTTERGPEPSWITEFDTTPKDIAKGTVVDSQSRREFVVETIFDVLDNKDSLDPATLLVSLSQMYNYIHESFVNLEEHIFETIVKSKAQEAGIPIHESKEDIQSDIRTIFHSVNDSLNTLVRSGYRKKLDELELVNAALEKQESVTLNPSVSRNTITFKVLPPGIPRGTFESTVLTTSFPLIALSNDSTNKRPIIRVSKDVTNTYSKRTVVDWVASVSKQNLRYRKNLAIGLTIVYVTEALVCIANVTNDTAVVDITCTERSSDPAVAESWASTVKNVASEISKKINVLWNPETLVSVSMTASVFFQDVSKSALQTYLETEAASNVKKVSVGNGRLIVNITGTQFMVTLLDTSKLNNVEFVATADNLQNCISSIKTIKALASVAKSTVPNVDTPGVSRLKSLKESGVKVMSRVCQKIRQPALGELPIKGSYTLKYNDLNYICPTPEYPYPGFTNGDIICCFKKDQRDTQSYKRNAQDPKLEILVRASNYPVTVIYNGITFTGSAIKIVKVGEDLSTEMIATDEGTEGTEGTGSAEGTEGTGSAEGTGAAGPSTVPGSVSHHYDSSQKRYQSSPLHYDYYIIDREGKLRPITNYTVIEDIRSRGDTMWNVVVPLTQIEMPQKMCKFKPDFDIVAQTSRNDLCAAHTVHRFFGYTRDSYACCFDQNPPQHVFAQKEVGRTGAPTIANVITTDKILDEGKFGVLWEPLNSLLSTKDTRQGYYRVGTTQHSTKGLSNIFKSLGVYLDDTKVNDTGDVKDWLPNVQREIDIGVYLIDICSKVSRGSAVLDHSSASLVCIPDNDIQKYDKRVVVLRIKPDCSGFLSHVFSTGYNKYEAIVDSNGNGVFTSKDIVIKEITMYAQKSCVTKISLPVNYIYDLTQSAADFVSNIANRLGSITQVNGVDDKVHWILSERGVPFPVKRSTTLKNLDVTNKIPDVDPDTVISEYNKIPEIASIIAIAKHSGTFGLLTNFGVVIPIEKTPGIERSGLRIMNIPVYDYNSVDTYIYQYDQRACDHTMDLVLQWIHADESRLAVVNSGSTKSKIELIRQIPFDTLQAQLKDTSSSASLKIARNAVRYRLMSPMFPIESTSSDILKIESAVSSLFDKDQLHFIDTIVHDTKTTKQDKVKLVYQLLYPKVAASANTLKLSRFGEVSFECKVVANNIVNDTSNFIINGVHSAVGVQSRSVQKDTLWLNLNDIQTWLRA